MNYKLTCYDKNHTKIFTDIFSSLLKIEKELCNNKNDDISANDDFYDYKISMF